MAKRVSGIADDEICARLEQLQELEASTTKYFRLDSPLWKAIKRYIENAKVGECVLCDKQHPVLILRGTGAAISYRRVYYQPAGADDPKNTVRLILDVTFYDAEEDREIWERNIMVDVPIDLMVNFTDDKFNAWIAEKVAVWKKTSDEAKFKVMLGFARNNPDLLKKVRKAIREGSK